MKSMNKLADNRVDDAPSQNWVYRLLPVAMWPYAQLARWDRPIGWWLLMWPGWWALTLASLGKMSVLCADPDPLLGAPVLLITLGIKLALFMAGAIVLRGAGCTFNDLADQNIDARVERTRSRPLPSGRISRVRAAMFLALQLAIGLLILLQFNNLTIYLGIASLVLVAIYPFMKRITWWPQLFLGLAFSWGALMGWTAIDPRLGPAPLLLYLGSILWVIGYDTIYAHQDKEDDALVGIKSTARLFAEKSKYAISALYSGALILIAAAFYVALVDNMGRQLMTVWPVNITLLVAAGHMGWQIKTLDINNARQCLKLFQANSRFGWILFIGLAVTLGLNSC